MEPRFRCSESKIVENLRLNGIHRQALALLIHESEEDLRGGETLFRRPAKPLRGKFITLPHTLTVQI